MLLQALCIISYPLGNSNLSYSPETPNLGQIQRFLEPCDLEIWRMTLQNNRAPLLCYFKLCASFRTLWELKLELQSGNAQFGSNSTIFRAVRPWNLMDEPKQGKSEGFESCDRPIVRKRPIWLKIGDVLSRVTLKFDGWPWKIQRFLEPCDLEIWRMTLQNNRAPLLCYFKLCASFRTHWGIQTWVTVRKRPIWVKFNDF